MTPYKETEPREESLLGDEEPNIQAQEQPVDPRDLVTIRDIRAWFNPENCDG